MIKKYYIKALTNEVNPDLFGDSSKFERVNLYEYIEDIVRKKLGEEAAIEISHGNLINLTEDDHWQYSLISVSTSVPTTTPTRVGAINVDILNEEVYVSVGNSSPSDWKVFGSTHNAVTVTDSSEINFTLTGQNITANINAGSIDETKLNASTNVSLDLADTSIQPGDNISTLINDSGFITATLTNEEVEDIVGNMLTGNTETLITVEYQDGDGTIDFIVNNDLSLYDNGTSAFITGNETITLSGDISGSGTTSITTTINAGSVDINMLSATGTADATTFLRGDNTWATPAGGGGGVDTSGTPIATDYARFTDADTIEGRSPSEVKADLAITTADITDSSSDNSDLATSRLLQVDTSDGSILRKNESSLKVLYNAGAPVDGTTVAWYQGQFLWNNTGKRLYAATTASTNPDSAGTGSVWEEIYIGASDKTFARNGTLANTTNDWDVGRNMPVGVKDSGGIESPVFDMLILGINVVFDNGPNGAATTLEIRQNNSTVLHTITIPDSSGASTNYSEVFDTPSLVSSGDYWWLRTNTASGAVNGIATISYLNLRT